MRRLKACSPASRTSVRRAARWGIDYVWWTNIGDARRLITGDQSVISHIFIGISDFNRAFGFYARIMADLGLIQKFAEPEKEWAGWVAPDAARPLFLIGKPYNGLPADPGNGQMVALLAPSREIVDRVHATALSLGAACEGLPGLRPHYHPHYYGCYFRDLDANKICVCCHQ